jgi:AbrB family looped-hinge helix DNA binding protein
MAASENSGADLVSLVRIGQSAEISLPHGVREALKVSEGDYLEVELVEGGVLLKPLAVIDQRAARERMAALLQSDRYIGEGPEPGEDELMRMAVDDVRAVRRTGRERSS